VSGGVCEDARDTKLVPVNEDDTPNTAAEMRSLADQAEAEATEAEAFAAAARARARAIRLRRQAERIDVAEPAKKRPAAEGAVAAEAIVEDEEAKPADSDSTEVLDTRGRRWLSRSQRSAVAAVIAIGVVLAATGASIEMIVDHRDAVRQRQLVAEFAAAARQGVVTLTSLDFEHAKEGIQNILEVSTGTFKEDILKMAGDFTNGVEQSKMVSQGSVQATAVELDSVTENSAVVLVASTSELTNAAGTKQDPQKYRLIVTVTRDGGQLKMSKVEFVS
jgi:Mce-associated membrane protein